jgi:hypothetical protein
MVALRDAAAVLIDTDTDDLLPVYGRLVRARSPTGDGGRSGYLDA